MVFEIKKNTKHIFIAGTGSGWDLLPKNTEHTVYCLNDYVYTEKYHVNPDKLFIMDILDEKPQVVAGVTNLGEVIERINKMKVPLIAPFRYEEIPLSEAFPIHEVAKHFGNPYFSNTIAYMIAYALLEFEKQAEGSNLVGYELSTFGVNQASSSEYFYEKAGVEYWLGIALGKGVKISINGAKSELLTNKSRFGGGLLYGYNQRYEEIVASEKKFGVPVIKKLTAPSRQSSREIRTMNS